MGPDRLAAAARQEAAGQGTFPVRVGCYSGGRYGEEPRWVEREGPRLSVTNIDARWQEDSPLQNEHGGEERSEGQAAA